MMRKRVDVRRVPTLKGVHPHTKWSLCLRVSHKFHIERIGFGRKRLNLVVLDGEVNFRPTFYLPYCLTILLMHCAYMAESFPFKLQLETVILPRTDIFSRLNNFILVLVIIVI